MRTHKNFYNDSLKCDNIVYFPISFTDNKFPLDPKNYTYTIKSHKINNQNTDDCTISKDMKSDLGKSHVSKLFEDDGHENITYKLKKPQKGLTAFGVWGRIFTRDVDHSKVLTDVDVKKFETILDVIYSATDNDPKVSYRNKLNEALVE